MDHRRGPRGCTSKRTRPWGSDVSNTRASLRTGSTRAPSESVMRERSERATTRVAAGASRVATAAPEARRSGPGEVAARGRPRAKATEPATAAAVIHRAAVRVEARARRTSPWRPSGARTGSVGGSSRRASSACATAGPSTRRSTPTSAGSSVNSTARACASSGTSTPSSCPSRTSTTRRCARGTSPATRGSGSCSSVPRSSTTSWPLPRRRSSSRPSSSSTRRATRRCATGAPTPRSSARPC